MSRALALLVLIAIPAAATAQIPTRNVDVLAHVDDYPTPVSGLPYAYSACWSYVHTDGREYAVIGCSGGTAIYNVSNPRSPHAVAFIPGPPSIWREIKQYRTWLYVVTEGIDAGRGLQIIRMTDPQHPVLAATYTAPNYVSAHTVTVDGARGILILNGTRSDAGSGMYPFQGMQIFSLANPEQPALLAVWPATGPYDASNYVHDAVVVGNRLYAACVYARLERVFDLGDPAHPQLLQEWTYPDAYYTHNSWPDSSGRMLYVTDEHNGEPLRVFDIQNLAAPTLVNGFTDNPHAIVHNAHVMGHELYLSNYTEGVRFLDLADPVHPAEYGWADSYPGPSGGYGGVWEVCPFFPSGIVIASDMESGLWVYRPVRDYGLLRVRVLDGDTGDPLPGVRVRLTPQGDSLITPDDGVVQFAPSPGSPTVIADRFGWTRAAAARNVVSGVRDTVTFALHARALTPYAGVVSDGAGGTPLGGGEVDLAYTTLQALTDSVGAYHFEAVPEDDYRVTVHRPGYVPLSLLRHVGPGHAAEDFALARAASWDSLESGAGWTVGAPGDDATAGAWTLVAPVGTGTSSTPPAAAGVARVTPIPSPASPTALLASVPSPIRLPGPAHETPADAPPAGQIKPWADRTPGTGTRCFVTGQAPSHGVNPDDVDLDGGRTTLTSPALNTTFAADPVIGYWRWFYSRDPGTGQPDPNDWLAVLVSANDGLTWTPVDTLRGLHNAWEETAIHVARYVTPTAQVRVRFVAADLGANTTAEAGIDDLTLYDGALTAAGVPPGAGGPGLRFAAPWPNPGSGPVHLALHVPGPGRLDVDVVDVAGRRVRGLWRGQASADTLDLVWDGLDGRGVPVRAGIYFVTARSEGDVARTRLVRLTER